MWLKPASKASSSNVHKNCIHTNGIVAHFVMFWRFYVIEQHKKVHNSSEMISRNLGTNPQRHHSLLRLTRKGRSALIREAAKRPLVNLEALQRFTTWAGEFVDRTNY